MTLEIDLPSRRSTLHLAKRLARISAVGDLIVLSGPLGAGKTFLVRGLVRALGYPAREPVTSPSFALVQEMPTTPPLAHADPYRQNGAHEVRGLGIDSAREHDLVVVEWAENYVPELG